MDVNQLAQLVQYFDEERRKDRALLVQMQERVESLLRENEARSRYSQNLETTVADLKARVTRAEGWQPALETARAEFKTNIARSDEQARRIDADSLRVRQVEIESVVRQLAELRKEVKPYARYADDFEARRQEESRLADLISKLQVQTIDMERRLEQPGAAISYLEEQRRQDNKRITALEQEGPEIRRRLDSLQPQLLLLDEAIRKKHGEIEEAARLLEAQSQVIENQRVADIRRERQFAEYAETVERIKQRADEVGSQAVGFVQLREEVRRELAALPEVDRRHEARINEVFELQRDGEERAKRQNEGFRDRMEKAWSDFTVQQEERWHERDRRLSDHEARFDDLEDEVARVPPLAPVYEILESFARYNANAGREWLAQTNQMLDRAKVSAQPEIKLSRRQRRKQAALKSAETGASIEPPSEDTDLLG